MSLPIPPEGLGLDGLGAARSGAPEGKEKRQGGTPRRGPKAAYKEVSAAGCPKVSREGSLPDGRDALARLGERCARVEPGPSGKHLLASSLSAYDRCCRKSFRRQAVEYEYATIESERMDF